MKPSIVPLIGAAASLLVTGVATLAAPPNGELKKAAAYVLSSDCGNSVADPGFVESTKLLNEAGEAIVPVLAELLADDTLSPWFVRNAAFNASRFPFSRAFCDALRHRRDDKRFDHDPGAMLGVFEYFAKFGSHTDLEWMERSVNRLGDRRAFAEKHIQSLRDRLQRE